MSLKPYLPDGSPAGMRFEGERSRYTRVKLLRILEKSSPSRMRVLFETPDGDVEALLDPRDTFAFEDVTVSLLRGLLHRERISESGGFLSDPEETPPRYAPVGVRDLPDHDLPTAAQARALSHQRSRDLALSHVPDPRLWTDFMQNINWEDKYAQDEVYLNGLIRESCDGGFTTLALRGIAGVLRRRLISLGYDVYPQNTFFKFIVVCWTEAEPLPYTGL